MGVLDFRTQVLEVKDEQEHPTQQSKIISIFNNQNNQEVALLDIEKLLLWCVNLNKNISELF